MKMRLAKLSAALLAVFAVNNAYAAEVNCSQSYGIQSTVNGIVGQTYCDNNSQTFIDLVKKLKDSNPNYNETAVTEVMGRFNDADITMNYRDSSTTLEFSSPDLGVEKQTFTGATRKESQDMFVDWLKKSGIITQVMQYQSKNSANSPITGSAGLMPTLARNDFDTATESTSNVANTSKMETVSGNLVGLGLNVGSYSIAGGEKVDTATLPLSYTKKMASDPRKQLIFTVPISMYQVGSAKGYHVGLGLAYRFPVNDRWTLTPAARYAVTGSVDRATVASVISGSLTSTYTIPLDQFELTVANMVGYYSTGKFKAGEYSFNPKIKETMLRNGVMLSQPFYLKGKKLAAEYSVIDTRYVGSNKPFMSNMQEYGVTVGLHKDEAENNPKLSNIRVGVTYMHGKGSKGFTANMGYWF
ncbi:hypothetical protein QDY68_05950 [Kingella negevensis]|uniref:hypothetical protein n=1 Tax=Kingella negevensis TaxID=1522312 RepID=UPI002543F994|nr:hypothetical protein [Kingella negevensis]MDK4680067.1 hypothetical protein [Kingella negevensis]MDK4682213.1 hypothetical protein [Kingella negevensis]MDK4690410.1 hypothetical protein [Kingella negevensis]MDK4692241.1 hypothetical protein [Kingella negevensis]MDK4698545.1 hypothetical protein [Kingella negevensis]